MPPSPAESAAPDGTPEPEVTIVVTPRERFGLTQRSLESMYRHTTVPFKMVVVDGHGPSRVREYLTTAATARGFDLVHTDRHVSPNRARNLGAALVTTPYIVFVDNDLLVTDGWLERLLACAEETGAGVVGPLYFEGDPGDRIIHMAGGDYTLDGNPGRRTFSTVHRLQGTPFDPESGDIVREPVDFVEFHCLMIRTELLRRLGGLDENLLSTREHLDLCLAVSAAGESVYFEPGSHVTYLTPPPVEWPDVPFYLRRWSEAWNEASLEHFCAKHGIEPGYAERIVGMRARRQILLDPVRRVIGRFLPAPVDRFGMRVMARVEREVNRLAFRRPADAA